MTIKRLSIWFGAALIVLAVAAAITLYWASRSETVLRWGLQQVAERMPCPLSVTGLRGSLLEPVRVERIVCDTDRFRVEAQDVLLAWSPLALWQRQVDISSVRAGSIDVVLKTMEASTGGAPTTLALPIPVTVAAAETALLSITREQTTVQLRNIRAAYRGDSRSHHLTLQELSSEWGDAQGEIQLGAAAPLPVTAKLDVNSAYFPDWPLSLHLEIAGELQQLDTRLQGNIRQQPFAAQAVVTPFAENPIPSVAIQAANISLSDFDARLPQTSLTLDLTGGMSGTESLSGEVRLLNATAGRLDQKRLPLTTLATGFNTDWHNLRLTAMQADLGAAGRARGAADLQQDRIELSLDVDGLDLQALHGKLRHTGLQGKVALEHREAAQFVRVDLRETKPVRINGVRNDIAVKAEAQITPQRIDFADLIISAGGAQARASGSLTRNDALAFRFEGKLANFDPARFGDFPPARINASLGASGVVNPQWRAQLHYRLAASEFRNTRLSGQGRVSLSRADAHSSDIRASTRNSDSRAVSRNSDSRASTREINLPVLLRDADIDLDLGGNSLRLSGDFGASGDSLNFSIAAPRLDRLDKRFSGKLNASGALSGTANKPAVTAQFQAADVGFERYRLGNASGRFSVNTADDPQLDVDVTLRKLSRDIAATLAAESEAASQRRPARTEVLVEEMGVTASGTLARHSTDIRITAPLVDLRGRADGGWDRAKKRWSGVITRLENRGDYAFALLQQTPFEFGPDSARLAATRARFSQTVLNIGESRFHDGTLVTSGSVTGVRASRLLGLLEHPPAIESTLVLSGRWDLSIGAQVDGSLEIVRSDGDIVIPGEEPVALGIKELRLLVRATANRLDAQAHVLGKGIEGHGTASTRLERRGFKWGVPGTAPLNLQASLSLDSMRALGALAGRDMTVDGRLRFSAKADGTVAQPRLSGGIDADNLRLEKVASGVFLRNGKLRAEFRNDVLTVTNFSIDGGTGTLQAQGRLAAGGKEPLLDLTWKADKLDIIQHPHLQLKVSGAGSMKFHDGRFALRGAIKADRGHVVLRSDTAPALGDDVVIVGRAQPSELVAQTRRADLDLDVDLGPDFKVIGRGIDARMTGGIKLTSSADTPLAANGEVRVASGTFEAYQTKLQIDAGVLNFSGPIDNPGLSIVALRKNQDVQAGVEVSGTAKDPRVRLVSNPDVPDPEKLSWLVLGRKVETSSETDAEKLQGAATALAAGLGTLPLQKQLASAVGLDELGFRPGDASQGGVLAVGKRLSDKVYVTHEYSINTATNTLRVSYQLSRRISLRTESGVTDAVDIFYTISFD